MVVIIMGVAGSGKTTVGPLLADKLSWSFRDADDFHSTANRSKMANGIPLTDSDRADWLVSLRELIAANIQIGQPLVLACSALKEAYRQVLQVNDEVCFVYLKGSYEQIKARLETRTGHYMSPAMLESQFEILEEPAQASVVDITMGPSQIADAIIQQLHLNEE